MAFMAAAPLIEGAGAVAGSTLGRATMFGLHSLFRHHMNQTDANGQKKQDHGLSQYVRENPIEAGVILGSHLNAPTLGARAATTYGSLSRGQFG